MDEDQMTVREIVSWQASIWWYLPDCIHYQCLLIRIEKRLIASLEWLSTELNCREMVISNIVLRQYPKLVRLTCLNKKNNQISGLRFWIITPLWYMQQLHPFSRQYFSLNLDISVCFEADITVFHFFLSYLLLLSGKWTMVFVLL